MIKVGIVGGTGYTGIELIRLLCTHPEVEISAVTSRSEVGKPLSSFVPNFHSYTDLHFQKPTVDTLAECDLVFFATPNGTAMSMTPELLTTNTKVIDLAADFRIKDVALWEKWYAQKHSCPELVSQAVYGMPEVNREHIKSAQLVANPGCYPTAVILGLIPLLKEQLVEDNNIIADTKSGVSGAGRAANVATLHAEVSENFKAYGIAGHRHQPEISSILSSINPVGPVQLTFVPHLLPMNRGIHATLYATSKDKAKNLTELYKDYYSNEPFVTVLDAGDHPETRAVRGTNHCLISVNRVSENQIVVLSVIDNLVKGAAGQAIHNMNLMYGLPETTGIEAIGLIP